MATYKRFEYYTRDGKKWTEWFKWESDNREPWQLKPKLKNEYMEKDE